MFKENFSCRVLLSPDRQLGCVDDDDEEDDEDGVLVADDSNGIDNEYDDYAVKSHLNAYFGVTLSFVKF